MLVLMRHLLDARCGNAGNVVASRGSLRSQHRSVCGTHSISRCQHTKLSRTFIGTELCRHAGRRRGCVQVASSSQAAELMSQGHQKYKEGNRMGALKLYERVLSESPSLEQRQEALYAQTCVHASFGDVEQAQMSLREGVASGLDFEAALENPEYLTIQSSPQMLVQLKKFARTMKQICSAMQPSGGGRPTASGLKPAPKSADSARQDLSDMLRTDITGMDASVGGIVKRVVGLLVTGLIAGTLLFYVGLQFAFPEGR